ncbi:phosphatidate phosphatase LPIN1 isoform X1 [Alosa sapidissima]|uniref:phosphatidate phosphatase LPIN1 isoform X1 n=2 Tax=Alosa sapidissima TaxID=34773 RepID=UPI001C08E5EC|nr:phosphatidate phosphatase LPIN1 isoform X1 [Alosa sapidissima]XP_041928279.1 phosphatidate phosphatase LPIN1 isoform X1 [Alosa sapidissima]
MSEREDESMIAEERSAPFCEGLNLNDASWSWTQTMNYVGQLAGQVFVQVKELYRGLNPATLSGCIDVIVVRQPDGALQCSPFHVRFGKMGVLRSREKLVDIEINGEPVSLHMKLGENGEAFFVKETENDQGMVPAYLATSPILSEGSALMESQLGKGASRLSDASPGPSVQTLGPSQASGDGSSTQKKRRKRRRKSQVDSMRRDDTEGYSEDEDMFTIDMSSDEEREKEGSRDSSCDRFGEGQTKVTSSCTFMQSSTYTQADGGWAHTQRLEQTCTLPIPTGGGLSVSLPPDTSIYQNIHSPNESLPSTPKSDSELTSQMGKAKADNPEMLWAWGELPQAAKPAFLNEMPEAKSIAPVSIPVSESTHFRTISSAARPETQTAGGGPPSLSLYIPSPRAELAGEEAGAGDEVGATAPPSAMEVEGIGAAARLLHDLEDGRDSPSGRALGKTDSPSKRKDKRSHHLGSDGVYLDDITELEPEVAALYFPKSEGVGSGQPGQEVRSANQSPQSVGSSGMDSGVDSYCDQTGDLPSIAISLCGGLTDNLEITKEQFEEKAISYREFADNPTVIDDPNLVVKIGTKYYNWATASPILLAMQVFQKPLPKATVENIVQERMPKKGGRWWFSWRGRSSNSKSESTSEMGADEGSQSAQADSLRMKDDSSSDEDNQTARIGSSSSQDDPPLTPSSIWYRKTLRLSSEQLTSLQLKEGPNDVVFSVTTQYQGTCRCEGTIYLWNWDDKIVISDIDGTITRSDTLGHILPTLGKDWTHQGIARLYHKVSQNGYKFMYCSARAIGMAGMTRGYLHWVNERGTMLPQGPVLLSPSSLFSALHREVIEKKPEKFKIECLTDIKHLFYPNTEPFYAAFGNRPTDVYSYKEVGVPLNRIFTVNPKGELIQEHAKTNISSYGRLCEVVDHVFPLMIRGNTSDFPCSDTYSQFTYWRDQLPEVEPEDKEAEKS